MQGLSDGDKAFCCESAIMFQKVLPPNLDLFFFTDEATFNLKVLKQMAQLIDGTVEYGVMRHDKFYGRLHHGSNLS